MMGQNKKSGILHLIASILLGFLGYVNMKMGSGFTIIYFIIAAFMLFMSLVYFSRKDDF
ncbi:MAG: hypothetical protein Q4C49_06150 [Bacillota bacterium]|nr:hypothetical protein [Bacillota bacterium]